MGRKRRNYSKEFKKDVVVHSLTAEKAVTKVAHDLDYFIAYYNLKRTNQGTN